MLFLCMLLFRIKCLFCCLPFYNNFSAVVLITFKVILLRVAMLAMLNIMIREQAILNWKNALQIAPKKLF